MEYGNNLTADSSCSVCGASIAQRFYLYQNATISGPYCSTCYCTFMNRIGLPNSQENPQRPDYLKSQFCKKCGSRDFSTRYVPGEEVKFVDELLKYARIEKLELFCRICQYTWHIPPLEKAGV